MVKDGERRDTMRHPEHDAISVEVRSWYEQSYPSMGIQVEQRRYGIYQSWCKTLSPLGWGCNTPQRARLNHSDARKKPCNFRWDMLILSTVSRQGFTLAT